MTAARGPAITVVMPMHRERTMAHHTVRALGRCVEHAHGRGIGVRVVAVLDRPDEETRAFARTELGPDSDLGSMCDVSTTEVDLGDAGLTRNAGVALATTPYVCVLDADNLPSRTWLASAVEVLDDIDGPAVAHPEILVTFGDRRDVWPQRSSADPRFNPGNLVDNNYWDTFCAAPRSLFERFPYAATGSGTGFGYEDWHWGTRIVAHGIPHVTVPETAYFYRIKAHGSVNDGHHLGGRLIGATELLADHVLAREVLADDVRREASIRGAGRRLTIQDRVLRARAAGVPASGPPPPRPPDLVRSWSWRSLRRVQAVVPDDYRYLYREARTMSDAEVHDHYRRRGRAQGWRPSLTDDERALLHPSRFDAAEYRLLHVDLVDMSDQEARRHYIDQGRHEKRASLLDDAQVAGLADFDVTGYRLANHDLAAYTDRGLAAHYVRHGLREGRTMFLDEDERDALEPVVVAPWLEQQWREVHEIEPMVLVPTEPVVSTYRTVGAPAGGRLGVAGRIWWSIIAQLDGRRPSAIVFAPWMRLGGADVLVARYAEVLQRSAEDGDVLIVTTLAASTHTELVPPGVRLLDLPAIDGWTSLDPRHQAQLVATMVVQLAPELVHVINSPAAYDAFERNPEALAARSRVYLSTFVIDHGPDGELYSYLAKRRTGFLDLVTAVVVDNQALVDQLHELYRYPRDLFHVHHQPVELPPLLTRRSRAPGDPLTVVWAARFDRQKRLDVLADVVEAAARAGIEVRWRVHGAAVMDQAGDTDHLLARLRNAGVEIRPPYSSIAALLTGVDAFVLTSENEGIPLTLLDVMAHQVPVVAPLVGGIPELVGDRTGYPVARCEDVEGYVSALRQLADDPTEAATRAAAAYAHLAREFSWDSFRRRVDDTPGYGLSRQA